MRLTPDSKIVSQALNEWSLEGNPSDVTIDPITGTISTDSFHPCEFTVHFGPRREVADN